MDEPSVPEPMQKPSKRGLSREYGKFGQIVTEDDYPARVAQQRDIGQRKAKAAEEKKKVARSKFWARHYKAAKEAKIAFEEANDRVTPLKVGQLKGLIRWKTGMGPKATNNKDGAILKEAREALAACQIGGVADFHLSTPPPIRAGEAAGPAAMEVEGVEGGDADDVSDGGISVGSAASSDGSGLGGDEGGCAMDLAAVLDQVGPV